jgi:hypothetical protein
VSLPRRDGRIWQTLKYFTRFNGNRPVFETPHPLVIQIEAANVEAWLFTGGWDGGVSPR